MRLGIALRLLGVLALSALLAFDGAAFKTHLAAGEDNNYTVVLKPGIDAALISSDHADAYGVEVKKLAAGPTANGYVASIGTKELDNVRSDENVSYVVLNDTTQGSRG